MARLTAILLAASTLAACGGTKAARDTTRPKLDAAAGRRQEARLLRDVRLIHREALRTSIETLKGTPGLRRATGRFLEDLDRSTDLARLRKNRLIDHAVGALGGTCDQCFQQLEAVRPIITR